MPLFSWSGEFTMSVKIDGRDATVYQEKHHQEGDGRTRSEGWICSEVGKSYTIELDRQGYRARLNPHIKHKDISAHLRVDGIRTEKEAMSRDASTTNFRGPINPSYQRSPYVFQKPELLADAINDDEEPEAPINMAIGTLEVSLYRVEYHALSKPSTYKDLVDLTPALSEKHKKGLLSSVTQYGPPVPASKGRTSSKRKSTQDKKGSPYCKMTIRYASKEVLQAMDIIPRDPRPPTPPARLPTSTPTPPVEAIDTKPLISRSPSPQVDVEATATLDRLRRARRELELKEKAWKQAREEMEEAERSLRSGSNAGNPSTKRKRGGGDADAHDDKAVLKRKLQSEMTEALRGYDVATIDLTDD